jgi:hypothetical protein
MGVKGLDFVHPHSNTNIMKISQLGRFWIMFVQDINAKLKESVSINVSLFLCMFVLMR